MKILHGWLVCLAGFPLYAGAIDASHAATAWLAPGDSLAFAVPAWNFRIHAASYGLPLTPSSVSFTLLSANSLLPASFEADLQSADGSYAISFGRPLGFDPGYLWSGAYTGSVSALEGTFYLTPVASQQIFGTGDAELVFRNLGPPILLGLPPNTLRQDLFVSLSGGPLSVGALYGPVLLQQAAPNEVPEPPSGGLRIALGLALCLVSAAHRHRAPKRS